MTKLKIFTLLIAIITIVTQLFVPLSMANKYEDILKTGGKYLFKVVPRDPADPFKGRYVRLTFPIERGEKSDLDSTFSSKDFPYRSKAYIKLDKTNEGNAKVVSILKNKPKKGDFVKVNMSYSSPNSYRFLLPFNRYYAEESKAPKIEAVLWNRNNMTDKTFHADVRIKNGQGVINELFVDNIPILEYLQNKQ